MQTIQPLHRDQHTLKILLQLWENAVAATHDFLPAGVMERIRLDVLVGLQEVEHLLGFVQAPDTILGFIGVNGQKVEMLFVDAHARGGGIGRQLLTYAISTLGTTLVDVNEQNPQAVGFYSHLGFRVYERSATDGQGNPFPILHMTLPSKETDKL